MPQDPDVKKGRGQDPVGELKFNLTSVCEVNSFNTETSVYVCDAGSDLG